MGFNVKMETPPPLHGELFKANGGHVTVPSFFVPLFKKKERRLVTMDEILALVIGLLIVKKILRG